MVLLGVVLLEVRGTRAGETNASATTKFGDPSLRSGRRLQNKQQQQRHKTNNSNDVKQTTATT
jgi:hypothetical protein